MRLAGTFKGSKTGVYTPPGEEQGYPYLYARVRDADGGSEVKVKPGSSDVEDLAELKDALKGLERNADIQWQVSIDTYGNVRYAGGLE